jgi:hypothetical protein
MVRCIESVGEEIEHQHEQNLEPHASSVESLGLSASVQPLQSAAVEHVSEQTEAENVRALINEYAHLEKRRKRLWWTVWGIMAGSILPLCWIKGSGKDSCKKPTLCRIIP